MIATFKPLIKTMLDGIDTLSFVYDYHEETPDGYPVATFEIARIGNQELDSCNNEVTYEFDIIIQQEVGKNSTHEVGRGELDDTIDEIIEEVNKNNTLGGTCVRSIISSIDFGNVITDKGKVLFASLRYVCVTTDFIK